jgi:hypothetical protein
MTADDASAPHPDIGPELRQLAQALLDRLDPAVRAAAAAAGEALKGPSRCQQVWCPVCAVAALVNGEQHPLLNLVAEHSVTLLTMLRTMTAEPATSGVDAPAEEDADDADAVDETPPSTQNGRYHQIPIVVEPAADTPSEAS